MDHLTKHIESFESQIGGFAEPLASEFREAARVWKTEANKQRETVQAALTKAPTGQVFRAGDPVDRDSEAFVIRTEPMGEIERQILHAAGCPALLIYGRRRMGKSTLVRNLSGWLPTGVQVICLSMQASESSGSLQGFVTCIEHALLRAVDGVEAEGAVDMAGLERLLGRIDHKLGESKGRVLLALDEYEMIDRKIGEGVFTEDLLAAIRESMQSHRNLTWAFIGVREVDELPNAPWDSYMVSARTIDIEPFSPEETRLLLTEPMKHSSLWRDDADRPRFEPGFWGEGGIDRIHGETGGWPHLVQLVAATTVDLLNDSSKKSVDTALLELALSKACRSGDAVLKRLVQGECEHPGEWEYVKAFAEHDTQPPPDDELVRRSLRRRLLVTEDGDRWRLRVPLFARWLRERR